ncbi:Ribosomal protein S18 acetylase RimI [Actinacidiphila yanglinensis]|uniref:Ribosomal protein S18 acetylase RimI n=1 Tax=Actinacidiphila yanglinensis TaxID=310779 RepID=A0A1H5SXW4_9ACTN|nr:GNAT family N-acetyltransferase [Actinacidiphila yanglinensis]SEF54778.1 Ribosomal protein S18 acetylase RimI [Actinacidiphila yanglinensis]
MNDSVAVRTATTEDIEGIVTCSVALLTEDAAVRDPRVEPLWALRHGRESFEATLADPACLLLVAADPSGRVVGYLIGVLAEPVGVLPIRSATLRALYVAPERRGGGTGARLTADFFGWAREKGAVRAEVNAYAENVAGRRFYERQGFATRAIRLDLDLDGAPRAEPEERSGA